MRVEDAITNTIHDCVKDITGYEEETASAVITAIRNAGYTIIPTELLRTALNFGYGKEPSPEGAIARANLRDGLPLYPSDIVCACGSWIHPDMPYVEVEHDGVLWHGNSKGGGHRADVDPS